MLNLIKENVSSDGSACVTFFLLHYILPPTKRITRKENNVVSHHKFTVLDSINSFFLVGSTAIDLENKLKQKIDEKLPIQPIIMITGTINDPVNITVYIDGNKYKFHSIVKAVEVCFKLFHILNLKYPVESILIQSFIEHFFFLESF